MCYFRKSRLVMPHRLAELIFFFTGADTLYQAIECKRQAGYRASVLLTDPSSAAQLKSGIPSCWISNRMERACPAVRSMSPRASSVRII